MKRTQQLITSLFVMLCCCTGGWAQNAVTICQKDGQTATFAFSEKPVISYSGNDLVMTTTKTVVSYPVYLLAKIAFDTAWEEDVTAVDEMKQTSSDAQFSFTDGSLHISGGEAGSFVTLYTVGGVQVEQCRLDANGNATISVQALNKGIYIVKTTRFTFKFQKP